MPSWTYNEFKHLGVDFDDPKQVETYETRQNTSMESERALVQRLGIQGNHTVLEYGAGTGAFALAAAACGAKVIAVDISPAMLAFAGRKSEEMKLNNIDFRRASYLTHQQPDSSVDFVVTKFALHHLPDFWKVAALRRISRSLKVGGLFYLQDIVFSFEVDSQVSELENWIEIATRNGSFSREEFEVHIREEFSTYGFLMEQILSTAGFRIKAANYCSKVQAEFLCENSSPAPPPMSLRE